MLFVVLLADDPKSKPKLPLISEKENLAVIEVKDRAALVVATSKKERLVRSSERICRKGAGRFRNNPKLEHRE